VFDTGAVLSETGPEPELADLARRFRPVVLAGEQVLPVPGAFGDLLPMGGLVKGTSVSVHGAGATSVALSVLSRTSRLGSWIAFVGIESLGWTAVARAGLDLTRTVAVDSPPTSRWATVTAALVDAFDVVVVDPHHQASPADARRLVSRVRERGSLLVSVSPSDGRRRFRWPIAPDLSLSVDEVRWAGLGEGSGHLRDRMVGVSVAGRRSADRRRRVELRLTVDGSDVVITPCTVENDPETDAASRHLRRVV
jgi:hypothetical protein